MIARPMTVLAGVLAAALAPLAAAQSDAALVGFADLQARLGSATPTGAGVQVGQVEGGVANYAPDPGHPEFTGKSFLLQSGFSGFSGHANAVGFDFYGNTMSIAPGITTIFNYEAGHWAQAGYLKTGSPATTPPGALPGPIRIFNHSWIGQFDTAAANNNCLRRADFAVSRDNVLMCAGMDNDEPSVPTDGTFPALMSHMFNGLAVGARDGTHTHQTTILALDGPARIKPEIVAPGEATSWATPVVSAVAALLAETARDLSPVAGVPNAQRTETLKALMLAGAKKESAHGSPWTNNPSTSGANRGVSTQAIDTTVGAGTVNVNNAHMILTAGEQNGSATVPATTSATARGWDLTAVAPGDKRYWRFNVHATAAAVSVIATWHRQVNSVFGASSLANFNLTLWRVTPGSSTLLTLVGDPGLPYFAAGNVVSSSLIQNIEHLYITGLAPGQYVLELSRVDTLTSFPTWDAVVAWQFPQPAPILGDIDGNGIVNGLDLALVLGSWTGAATYSPCPPFQPTDLNQDCKINGLDIAIVLGNWG